MQCWYGPKGSVIVLGARPFYICQAFQVIGKATVQEICDSEHHDLFREVMLPLYSCQVKAYSHKYRSESGVVVDDRVEIKIAALHYISNNT